ncbi:nucleoside/nucleotide kinase family protein [Streptomyces sp. NBC_00249]|uniref:nucleoside/nucleotide kinase family protein n=1 Tax=Streptomyces sp. NBC_00249 TaxID=2975690 RepID=UPI0022512A83|nr:nucleoside/nucleotide kinase family protein [Streptomyces sp. NBC_00249]MCX5195463.1 nucleoside/nucleotide kinase family protein [Streptomyces sp. NBC_00249]
MAGPGDLAALELRARALAASGRRRILGIAGAPGAGKSTLSGRLAAALGPGLVAVVPMDGFHLAQRELVRLGRADRKGAPDTFDAAGYVALLRRLRAPETGAGAVYAPAFDRELEEPVAGSIAVAPGVPLVITEGNYLLHEDGAWAGVRPLLDEVWFLAPDDSLRVRRLIDRHVRHGKEPAQAASWVSRSDEANAALIAPGRARADLVVE